MHDDQVNTVLSYFHCNQKQQQIYLLCLQQGPLTVQELATILSINRVTVHSSVEELMKKGLLYETWKGKKRLIVSEGVNALYRLFENKKAEMQKMEATLKLATEAMKHLSGGQKVSRPGFKFYEGVVGFRKMLEETLDSKDYVYIILSADVFSQIVDTDYFLQYFSRRASKGIATKVVYPTCDFARSVNRRAKEYNMEVRVLPAEVTWSAGIFSWNDTVALLSFSQQSYLTTTIVENRDIAHMFQSILFDSVFSRAKAL